MTAIKRIILLDASSSLDDTPLVVEPGATFIQPDNTILTQPDGTELTQQN